MASNSVKLLALAYSANTAPTFDPASAIRDVEYSMKKVSQSTEGMYDESHIGCAVCALALVPAQFVFTNEESRKILESLAIDLCEHFKIEGGEKAVCNGAVTMMADQLLPAIAQGLLSAERVCDETLHLCVSPDIKELSAEAYVEKQINSKPDIIKDNHYLDNLYLQIQQDTKPRQTIRSIQISDIHIDFQYKEGAPNECNFPICCRDNGVNFEVQHKGTGSAGKWGDYKCDIPHMTMKNMFEWIANNQDELKTDFITWTGDNSAHNVWDNTQEEITEYTVNITRTLQDALGPDSTIPIFPIQGNHDTWPVNVQDFSKPNSNWAINHFKDAWTSPNWLSQEEADVFSMYGYYSKVMPFNKKGKVIGLNMQACNDLNWWMLDNRIDPGHQLQWLDTELAQIEKDEGFAMIIAHIPSMSCLHEFGFRYKALMERYQHLIRFQTFGHTHDEDFYITQSIEDPIPIGWSFVAGSVTTESDRNPAFTVTDFDAEFMVPTNVHVYYMNMITANANVDEIPVWEYLHDWKSEYNLKDMSPSSMLNFTQRLYHDADLASQYEWNRGRQVGDKPSVKAGERGYLCQGASEAFEQKDCFGSKHIDLIHGGSEDWFNYLIGNWIKVTK